MPNKTDPTSWEFAKYALQRNDEAIRFSETKTALLFTINGLILGIIADKILMIKDLCHSPINIVRVTVSSAIVAILLGVAFVSISSLLTVFPRLHASKVGSYLYFENLIPINLRQLSKSISTLDSESKLEHLISQVHATALIAHRKFFLIRFTLVGTTLILIGSILVIISLFVA